MVKKLLNIKAKYLSREKIKALYSRFISFLQTTPKNIFLSFKTVAKKRYGFKNAFNYSRILIDVLIFSLTFCYVAYYYYLSTITSLSMLDLFAFDFTILVAMLFLNKCLVVYASCIGIFLITKIKKISIAIYKNRTYSAIHGKKTILLNTYITIKFFLFLANNARIFFNYSVVLIKRAIIFVYFFVTDSVRGYFTLRGQHNKSLFVWWRPIFKKWSYFGLFRAYRSKWIWNK